MSAAADLTRFPLVKEFRLVDVVASSSVPPIPETTDSTDEEDIRYWFYELGCAKFTATRAGRRITITLIWVKSLARYTLVVKRDHSKFRLT
jgi:hypothetical protein